MQRRTGLPLDPLLTATKWAWLLNEQPDLLAELERGTALLGTVDAWLLYNLTDGRAHATDFTNASRVALLNLETSIGTMNCSSCLGFRAGRCRS